MQDGAAWSLQLCDDATGQEESKLDFKMTITQVQGLLIALLCLLNCGTEKDVYDYNENESYLLRRAAEVRELEFLDELEIRYLTSEEFRQNARNEVDTARTERLIREAETYGRLGYFPVDIDIVETSVSSSTDWVGGSYSPSSKLITVVGEPSNRTLVHEFIHALQDQHYGISDYDGSELDGFLARRSIIEGGAVLFERRFTIAENEEDESFDFDHWIEDGVSGFDPVFAAWRAYSNGALNDDNDPPYFSLYRTLVYGYGLEYCVNNLLGIRYGDRDVTIDQPIDVDRHNELWTDRPVNTTQEVLSLGDINDPVMSPRLYGMPSEHKPKFTVVGGDQLGQWGISLLLHPLGFESAQEVNELTNAWDGDRVLFVQDKKDDAYGLVWVSVWDTEQDAVNMIDYIHRVHGYTGIEDESGLFGESDNGELMWIEQRDRKIVVTRNIKREFVTDVVEKAFDVEFIQEFIAPTQESYHKTIWQDFPLH